MQKIDFRLFWKKYLNINYSNNQVYKKNIKIVEKNINRQYFVIQKSIKLIKYA